MKSVDKGALSTEHMVDLSKANTKGRGSKQGRTKSQSKKTRNKRTKKRKRKKKSKWESILIEMRVILAILLIVGGASAKLHPGDQNHVLRRLVLAFFHSIAFLLKNTFGLDKDSAEIWGGVIGISILLNLILFILGGVEELKRDWTYFFSRKIREEVRKEAKKDRTVLVFQIGASLILIFYSVLFPLFLIVLSLTIRSFGF